MLAPPANPNPWVGLDNPAVPYAIGGVFVAWGWLRDFVSLAIPSAISDLDQLVLV